MAETARQRPFVSRTAGRYAGVAAARGLGVRCGALWHGRLGTAVAAAVRGRSPRQFAPTFVLGLSLLVAGCVGGDGGVGVRPQPDSGQGTASSAREVLGTGDTTIALLLPIGAGGSASGLADAFRNAAELALAETSTHRVRILVMDTGGSDTGGQSAAQSAISEGARLILGPVFAPAVSGAAGPAKSGNVPVIAFSTDATVAGSGVWLLSFLPRQDVTRIIAEAASAGVEDIAGLFPDNGYGVLVEAAFRSAAARRGIGVTAADRYSGSSALVEKARALAASPAKPDAIFIPNGGGDPKTAAETLFSNGLNKADVRLLGSGQWDTPAVIDADALVGAWYPAPSKSGFASFSDRYKARYGAAPPRTASLVYDAVMLANGLVQAHGPDAAFATSQITNPDGFLGIDGIFRFTRNGLSERGLAVFLVGPGGTSRVVSPAPTRFDRGNF